MPNRETPEVAGGGRILSLPVAAGAVIYEGCMVALDSSGYAKEATKVVGLTAAGRAETFVDNKSGTAGDQYVTVRRGVFVFDNTNAAGKITAAHVLKPCYIADSVTVTATDTGTSVAGKVISVTDDGVAVEIL